MNKSKNKTLTSNLKFYLINKDDTGENISEEMQTAFRTGREYMPFANGIQWISTEDCMKLNSKNIAQTDVFVYPKFDGKAFEYLKTTSALILGPRCFMSCLLDNIPVPLGSSPVFTSAMNGLVVAASGLTTVQKTDLEKLIKLMGGHFVSTVNMATTHLVSNTVKSNKYEKAGETQKIKIMHPDWVDDVWRISQIRNILATDIAFDKHILPVFYNLKITTTELTANTKNDIKKLIDTHGGTFIGAFHSDTTDILVLEAKSINSPKYTAAVRYKKDCVTPQWIYDSVSKGYAVGMTQYLVESKNPKISTPTKSDCNASLNCSQLSIISHNNYGKKPIEINETITTRTSNSPVMNTRTTRASKSINSVPPASKYKEVLSKLNLQTLKKIGPLLEECCVYLSGFTSNEKVKLNKLLNIANATRYDEPVDKVTHVIIGEENLHELKLIKKKVNCHFVKVDWLHECIKQKEIVDENKFLLDLKRIAPDKDILDTPSPSSKKLIHSMSNTFKKPKIPKFDLDVGESLSPKPGQSTSYQDERESEIIKKYLQESQSIIENKNEEEIRPENKKEKEIPPNPVVTIPIATVEQSAMMTPQVPLNEETFLKNFKICVFGFEEEIEAQLVEDCKVWGADVVDDNFTDAVDYMIVPVIIRNELSPTVYKAKNIVNELWVEDVVHENRVLDLEYYHKPVVCAENFRPLEGLTIVFSTYTGIERTFLSELGTGLGANVESTYNRNCKPILICPKPEGQKYDGSVKWNLPAVTKTWLLDCVALQKRPSFTRYTVGKGHVDENVSHIIPSTQKSFSLGSAYSINKKRKSDELGDDAENRDITNNGRASDQKTNKIIAGDATLLGLSPTSNDSTSPASYRVKDFSTPMRDLLYRGWKEKEAKDRIDKLLQTPGTNHRLQKDASTPKLPENMRTPEAYWGFSQDSTPNSRALHRNQMSVLQNFHRPQSEVTPTTPFSEMKKKFWQDIFGEPTDDGGSNTQILTQKVDTMVATQGGATQHTAAEHVKELREYIKNRSIEQRSISYQNYEDVDSIPLRANSEMIGTENEVIGWRDPHEFNDLRRNNKEPMKYKGVPSFIISCTDTSTKDKLIKQIQQLKGQICDPYVKYDPCCTHVVCEQPNRGEKICSAIASGKWILDISYVQESIDAGFFLDEEQYEWGNPKASNLPELRQMEQSIANAAHRWRVRILTQPEKKSGVFTGFRVILHLVKKDQFAGIIKAGGGVVIDVMPPYENSDDALSATHCFVEHKKLKLLRDDHKALAESGVQVLNVMYLNAYLASDNITESSKYHVSLD